MAINKFTGTTNNNWGTATNWSQGTIPTASDGHITTFDATSPDCTVNSSARNVNTIDFTGYINTITMTFGFTSAGAVTFSNTMSVAGTGNIVISAAATLTTNGFVFPNNISLSASLASAFTFADAVTIGGNFVAGSGSIVTLNGNLTIGGDFSGTNNPIFNGAYNIYLAGNFTQPNGTISGTASWIWNGSVDKTWTGSSNQFKSNLTVNGSGVLTFVNTFSFNSATFQVLSNVITSDCLLNIAATATTTVIDTPLSFGAIWKGLTITNAAGYTVQFNSSFYTYNTVALGTGSQTLTINGSAIYIVNGTLQSGVGTASIIQGTSQIYCIGDKFTYVDAATGASQGQGNWRIPITIDVKGTILMIGRIVLSNGSSFSILNGDVNNIAGVRNLPELVIQSSMSLINIHKCSFKNITISSNQTVTMNEFFSGSPDNKPVIRVTGGSSNYKIVFTDTKPKKAFFVNVKNCTIQTTSNQLNIIGRDSNAGLNSGIIFGESGINGFPLNTKSIEPNYTFQTGLNSSMNN